MKQLTISLSLVFIYTFWGFYAHRLINRQAAYSLPPEMIVFYKKHISYLEKHAVDPDKRRYAIKEEAPRHYIDLDDYGDSAAYKLPRYWREACEIHSEDTLMAYGIVPWHIQRMKYRLTDAFARRDKNTILKVSAEIGHYIGDANVPLHTTKNYNGQLTDQVGIHGLWESRLPELFVDDYDLWIGKARYIDNTQIAAWHAVIQANNAVDSVLSFDKAIKSRLYEDQWYSYETRGKAKTHTFSADYAGSYHKSLRGMVERQLRKSIIMTASFWYTCWVDAGQPDLNNLTSPLEITDSLFVKDPLLESKARSHEH